MIKIYEVSQNYQKKPNFSTIIADVSITARAEKLLVVV